LPGIVKNQRNNFGHCANGNITGMDSLIEIVNNKLETLLERVKNREITKEKAISQIKFLWFKNVKEISKWMEIDTGLPGLNRFTVLGLYELPPRLNRLLEEYIGYYSQGNRQDVSHTTHHLSNMCNLIP
jgi:hypothetical protein